MAEPVQPFLNEREISLTWLCYAAHTAEPTLNGRHLKLEKQMNVFNFPRGTICVQRVVHGNPEWLRIHDQRRYAEWVGCFSVL